MIDDEREDAMRDDAREATRLVHITHAAADDDWVRGTLIPALGLPADQVWTREEDDVGAPRLAELARAARACTYTVLVVSAAAQADAWASYGGVLAEHLALEDGKPRLLVVVRDVVTGPGADAIAALAAGALARFDCADPVRAPRRGIASEVGIVEGQVISLGAPLFTLRSELASDRAAYVNGTELIVDGGLDCMLMDMVPRPGFNATGQEKT